MQREIGVDTANFASALRAVLRQDPDVIMIGEMRDTETIDIALKAAETGHLVISTAHTTDAAKTVQRLLAVFSPSEQAMMRMRLAESLRAVVSQRLLPRLDGKGVVPAVEVMVATRAIQECIRDESRTHGDHRVHREGPPLRHADLRPAPAAAAPGGRDLEGRRAHRREQPGRPGPPDPRRRRRARTWRSSGTTTAR